MNLYYLWYTQKTCEVCGKKFMRIREHTLLQTLISKITGQPLSSEYSGYVCSMGCALSAFSRPGH